MAGEPHYLGGNGEGGSASLEDNDVELFRMFNPVDHGLDADFRLTKFTELRG